MDEYSIETKAIHLSKRLSDKGSLNVPIYQNSTFAQVTAGDWEEYTYSRTNNPTEDALRKVLAELENGSHAVMYSSGLAAIASVMELLNAGDHVISMADIYGGTFRFYGESGKRHGLEFSFINTTHLDEVKEAITPSTKMIFVETPSNPQLQITDLAALSKLAKEHDLLLVVDNTMATPVFQNPLDFGVDIVVHSTSKYISGHTNVIGGATVVNNEKLYDQLRHIRKATGASPGPFDCYLTLLGIKTLPLRMKQHQENAYAVAQFLEKVDGVSNVMYLGLKSHPQYDLMHKQMSGAGGIISFEINEESRIDTFIKNLELFSLAVSFGSVASLIDFPAKMSHKDIPTQQRLSHGVSESMVRLSIGIENKDDLIADLEQAFKGS